ncbi:hypothetical protein BASA83_008206 [Batrachochytrium salamandrivorans]|nr:hypothetical protein BASA62_006465 [Batrachochytrium salamandrivorans]KAH9269734.1 hypothetical protein BASA83_008206 [Batrachochytrium salamandrivorans]
MLRRIINRIKVSNHPWKSTLYVGSDLDGNMYFEGPPVREGISLSRRSIEYADGRSHISQYEPNAIPELMDEISHRRFIQQRVQEIATADLEATRFAAEGSGPLLNSGTTEACAEETSGLQPHLSSPVSPHKTNRDNSFAPESWQPSSSSKSKP